MTRVLLAEDDPLVRAGVPVLLVSGGDPYTCTFDGIAVRSLLGAPA